MPTPDAPKRPEPPQSEAQILSPDQLQAINLILAGKNYTEIADILGKDRRTLYGYRQNPHFISELNGRRKEMYEAGQVRLQGLLHKAVTVLEQKLDEGNFKAALEVLKLLNVTAKTMKPEIETDPEAIAAREAERMAYNSITATPFGQEDMGIGAYRNKEVQVLADDIFELLRKKYHVPTKLEELIE